MWELRTLSSWNTSLSRRILAYVVAAFIAAILFVTTASHPTFATDASWSGASISYDNKTYAGPASAATVSALGLPTDTKVYTYVEPVTASNRKIHVIYFAPGSDPGTASEANYRTYAYLGPNSFNNGSTATAVSLTPQTPNDGTSSCVVDGGLGWIICPVTNTLATWMDWIFDVLASFLNVRPLETGTENAMHRAWSYMRTFANIAFVIAFLIIIYSQLTNYGVSNYGIKKLLPRIIIAAILVNISYLICSIAIDISNVLGHSIQNLFIGMRNTLVGTEGNTWDALGWESVSSFILSGGTLAVAGGIAAVGSVTSGSVALLLPALVTLLVAVLVALLIMAARQAIITVLTVLSPLAFVAYLLPNTEKWFEKWRGTFMTMLILFPAFSIIFGGSQLAGTVIIQNADSINLIILGMIVQVAPLFVTPFLIKFSGSLLGRIAGMVNNPNKGLIDRTRNFAKDRAENAKARRLGTPAAAGLAGARQRAAQRLDHNRRRREGWRNAHNALADANWANSRDFSDIDQESRRASDTKQRGELLSEERYNISKTHNATLQQLDVDVRQAKLNLDNAKLDADIQNWERNHAAPILESRMREMMLKEEAKRFHDTHEIQYDEFKSGEELHLPMSAANRAMQARAMRNADVLSANALRKASAQRVLTDQFTEKLEQNTEQIDGKALQEYAGGIDPNGNQRALATALNARSKAFNEAVDTMGSILINKNYSDAIINDIALDKYTGTDITVTPEMRLAAMRKISKSGNAKEIIRLTENLNVNDVDISQDFRQEIADNLLANGNRPKWVGAGVIASIKDGSNVPTAGTARTDKWILDAFDGGKLSSADLLVQHDNDYLTRIADTVSRRPNDFMRDPAKLADFEKQLKIALTDQRYSGRLGERKATIQSIKNSLGFNFTED